MPGSHPGARVAGPGDYEMETVMEMEPGYQAALEGAAFLHRKDRRFLEVTGRDPGEMLKGVLSGTIPLPLRETETGLSEGAAPYSTVLTPKGKMVTDLRVIPRPPEGFLLELPEAGLPGLEAHFRKYLNPRFAQLRDRSGELGMVSVVGPRGREILGDVLGSHGRWAEPDTGVEDPAAAAGGPAAAQGSAADAARCFTHPAFGPVILLENRVLGLPALDVVVEAAALGLVKDALEKAGVSAMTPRAWEVLRIEAGTPAFGLDMTEETIPVEAGIHGRAIDYRKGCYTGQEVIIRIRDRGKVSKRLARIILEETPPPAPGTETLAPGTESLARDTELFAPGMEIFAPGTELFAPETGKPAGWITSSCVSPRLGRPLALGYVKRAVEPGEDVGVGSPEGLRGRVEALH